MRFLGKYFNFVYLMFVNKESFKTYLKLIIDELVVIGVDSVVITCIISVAMGAVTSIQIASNMSLGGPMVPDYIVGLAVRNMTILELSPTLLSVVFAGKIGSSIASQLSSMRISEQIDALEIMGINTISYLVLPKVIASVLSYPLLITISSFLSIYSGYIAGIYVSQIPPEDYIKGVTMLFRTSDINLAICKSLSFGFLVSTISAYNGFFVYGGALAVGKASTKAVTYSCIAILIADYLIIRLFL